ncbi:MAG: 6-carboxytetrahydropterin synthase [Thermoanaerobaculia bacterium]
MTAPGESYTLVLAKEDFKFSSGHFTVFAADRAELLHGHNYQVAVELCGSRLDDEDLLTDFGDVKGAVRELCERLDSRTLVPSRSSHLQVVEDADAVEITFRDRVYRLPARDVLVLPLINTSIEALARMLWQQLVAALELPRIEILGVNVAETAGQSCWYRAPVSPHPPGDASVAQGDARHATRRATSLSTSPGSGNRPVAFFE